MNSNYNGAALTDAEKALITLMPTQCCVSVCQCRFSVISDRQLSFT
jgi:hypothetical protein